MVQGLSHITLVVQDLEKSSKIVTDVLGGKELYDSAAKNFSISHEKFFDVNGMWIVLMEGSKLSERTYNHIAFQIAENELNEYLDKVIALNLEVKESRPRSEEEGQSIYFYDYDNHLFELHTGTLSRRLTFYKEAK